MTSIAGLISVRVCLFVRSRGNSAWVTSADGSLFSGEIFFCQNDDCSDRRGGTGPVTFIRQ
jgi:hypothetical protein